MLEIITKSKTRQKLLKLLLLNKNQKFYLSEIAQKIDVSIGTTQRELNKLANFEMVISEKRGNMRYYFINKQNQFLNELKKIVI
ncbi:winged helix-turn-helix transcriptional regulator [Candidatus Parcubacteria bacterium]|nr:winged helix-turn-helix transcriptional regulator [Candidatus Parcubacteria bacterium]